MKRLLILFCFAFTAAAQTPVAVQNPSFESTNAILYANTLGRWNLGPIPGWTTSAGGSAGSFQPTGYASLSDGKTVAYVDGGSLSQDLGVTAQANTNYSLSVYVGHRADGYVANYTISLSAGTVVLCSSSASNSSIPAGTFQQVTLACPITTPSAGNLVIMLGSSGQQINFDNVTLTSQSVTSPQPDSITVKAQLLWCSLCDHTDDVPATGNLVVAQTGGPSSTQNILPDGTVVMSGTIDVAQDPLEFTIYLTDENGASQPGANLTLRFPKFELASPGFTFGTVTLGTVRIAHTTDADGNPAVRIVDVTSFSIGK